ncbi:MAG: dihydrofolate reductase family protein, partial [Bacteroidota bacterium]
EGNLTFYNGDLKSLVQQLKQSRGQNIFCDGGAEIVTLLLAEKLIDEIILSIIPILIGDGIRLFKNQRPEQELQLVSSKKYDSGLVQLHYQVK